MLKKREYPKEIYIGGSVYKIKFVRTVLRDHGNAGCCDPEKKEIRIKYGQSPKETFSTFVHECIHALEFEHDLRISHKLVYQLELAVMDFLMQNL